MGLSSWVANGAKNSYGALLVSGLAGWRPAPAKTPPPPAFLEGVELPRASVEKVGVNPLLAGSAGAVGAGLGAADGSAGPYWANSGLGNEASGTEPLREAAAIGRRAGVRMGAGARSEEHTSELQSRL